MFNKDLSTSSFRSGPAGYRSLCHLGWLAALMGEKYREVYWATFSPAFCWTVIQSSCWNAFFHASCHCELIKRGIGGMLIIKALVVGSALMLLTSCAGYLTNYQTPCVQGHVMRMCTVHDG